MDGCASAGQRSQPGRRLLLPSRQASDASPDPSRDTTASRHIINARGCALFLTSSDSSTNSCLRPRRTNRAGFEQAAEDAQCFDRDSTMPPSKRLRHDSSLPANSVPPPDGVVIAGAGASHDPAAGTIRWRDPTTERNSNACGPRTLQVAVEAGLGRCAGHALSVDTKWREKI